MLAHPRTLIFIREKLSTKAQKQEQTKNIPSPRIHGIGEDFRIDADFGVSVFVWLGGSVCVGGCVCVRW